MNSICLMLAYTLIMSTSVAFAGDGASPVVIVREEGVLASAQAICRRGWSDVIIDQSNGSIVLVQHTDTNGIRRVFHTVQGRQVQYTWQVYMQQWNETNTITAGPAQRDGLAVIVAKPARLILRDGYTGDTLAVRDVDDTSTAILIESPQVNAKGGYPIQINTLDRTTSEITGGALVWYKQD